jgi:predicted  nucleic acid-binding Zn-ribbon protein
MEEEFERVKSRTQDVDHELSSRSAQVATLQERLAKSEAEVTSTRNDLKAEREGLETRLAQRLEDEKARIREETARSTPDLYQHFRNESPVTHNRSRNYSNGDKNSPFLRRGQGLAIIGTGTSPLERPVSRKSSTQPLHTTQNLEFHAHHRHLSRQDSMSTLPQASFNNGIPESPSVIDKDDDFFAGVNTPATPDRTINDLISVSTAAAGPSVQLVERMSAAVRRLESEKAAHKDDLNRLSSQRDESREQVVSLMREVEEKRGWELRVKELEGSLKGVEERYLTTLEMLGEKSEKVEELKADVQDLKTMYRELVDSTMR